MKGTLYGWGLLLADYGEFKCICKIPRMSA